MLSKKIICFVSVLLLFSALLCSVNASSDTTASIHGGGVTIYLTYPKEAYPNMNITHYITINSTSTATLQNFTVIINAPANSSWQEIFNAQDTFNKPLPTTYNLTLSLPQETSGTLQCSIFVDTTIIDDLSTTLYTTLVSDPTFSELQILYDEMLANYTSLQEDYETLLDDYDSLLADYSSLSADYTVLLSEYDTLANQYQTLLNEYTDQSERYNTKKQEYNTLYEDYRLKTSELGGLRSEYELLNSTYNSLQENCTSLQTNYTSLKEDCDALNKTYSDLLTDLNNLQEDKDSALNTDRSIMIVFIVAVAALIAFIVYLKRKKEQPYVVIRKETVSMKPDEKT